jgi:hypothetical protein
MIGLLAQNFLLSDQLVFLTKQNLFACKSRPQQAFREPMFCQLALVACHRAALRDFKHAARRWGRVERRMFRGHVVSLPCRIRHHTFIMDETYDEGAKTY